VFDAHQRHADNRDHHQHADTVIQWPDSFQPRIPTIDHTDHSQFHTMDVAGLTYPSKLLEAFLPGRLVESFIFSELVCNGHTTIKLLPLIYL
jgi:hypothetical protein